MKKILAFVFAASLVTGFVACGPSDEEKKQDSINDHKAKEENDAWADSVMKAMEQGNSSDSGKKDTAKH